MINKKMRCVSIMNKMEYIEITDMCQKNITTKYIEYSAYTTQKGDSKNIPLYLGPIRQKYFLQRILKMLCYKKYIEFDKYNKI